MFHSIITERTMPNKRRAASLSLLCIFAFFFFLHYDDELSSATKRNNSSSTTTITSRKLLGLISFQDPKTVNLQDRDTESGILSTDAPVKIPCSSDDETLLLVQEFYDDHQHANCRHDFSKDIIFLHLGKGGGGTVQTKLEKARISDSLSHPVPAVRQIEDLQTKGGVNTALVAVREPVERFISAFKWDLMRHCDGVKNGWRCCRDPNAGEVLIDDESTFSLRASCEVSFSRGQTVREKYNSNPNMLALALCGDDKSSAEYLEAQEDYSNIEHGMTLTQWLGFLVEPKDIGADINLVVLPMEEHFEQDIDAYIFHLLQTRYDAELATHMMQTIESKKEIKRMHSTGHVPFTPLTPVGDCCMTRYLEDDYRLIQAMLGEGSMTNTVHPVIRKACTSWGSLEQQQSCLNDLSAMLARRAGYLDRSKGTCSELFG